MNVEIEELRHLPRAKSEYISQLQRKGALPRYFTANGYAAYSPEDLANYKANVRRGRPPKKLKVSRKRKGE